MSRKRKDKTFWESANHNDEAFQHYYMQLLDIGLSVFNWTGLPETIDPRFMELTIMSEGKAVFFKDEELGFLALQCAANGPFNVYRIPINRRAYAVNGYSNELDESNSVIIYNNMLKTVMTPDLEWYARRIADLDCAMDVNAKAQKTPVLIECYEDELLTMNNAYMKYSGNMPVIFSKKNTHLKDNISVLRTDAPYVADKLEELKLMLWNEALTFLGISNVNVVKKERLVSDEVRRNLGGTYANRQSRLKMRQEACEQINKMFGLNVWCEFNDDINVIDEDVVRVEDDGSDESIHS